MILVSKCFCGFNCRYDGKSNFKKYIYELYIRGQAIPDCPEQSGGLPCPRNPSEIINGTGTDVLCGKVNVISSSGENMTNQFIMGAEFTLKLCKKYNIKVAVLKSNSPSCGFGQIYDGTFSGTKIKGNGVTAELLYQNGIVIFNENNFIEFCKSQFR